MLTTTVEPTSGSARLGGHDVAEEPLAARRLSSVVFQEAVVDRSLSGRRNLEIHASLWGVDRREAQDQIGELAETVGVGELLGRAVATYSGRERRRLELARALGPRPRAEPRRGRPAAARRPRRHGCVEKGAPPMSALDTALRTTPPRARRLSPLVTLAQRRFELTARTPRELVVPLLTPIMFAAVIAPALMTALHTATSYEAFVAVGTVGLLIPLNTMFSGLSVIVDRESGAQRELLTAPIPRSSLVLGNLVVAL